MESTASLCASIGASTLPSAAFELTLGSVLHPATSATTSAGDRSEARRCMGLHPLAAPTAFARRRARGRKRSGPCCAPGPLSAIVRRMTAPARFALASLLSLTACGAPILQAAAPQIRALPDLEQVMDASATTADPQFKKVGAASYSDADWASFAETASRLDAVGERAKAFTMGADFDKLADQLRAQAAELGKAVSAKDVGATSKAIDAIHGTCRTCHSAFK
ncbi:MAG: cytochrome c [Polyangiales bacterium]